MNIYLLVKMLFNVNVQLRFYGDIFNFLQRLRLDAGSQWGLMSPGQSIR